MQLYVKVAQAQPGTGQEFLPIWLALYRMQDGQQKQVSRIRLFKAKGLRVAAGEGFSADKETVLHIQELQATISDQAPYVLVVGAMAQGQQRSFDIVVSAKPLVRQLGNADGKALIEMVRWVPETIPIKEDLHVDVVHEHFESKKHCNS